MQQNINGSDFFKKPWAMFRDGFGDPMSDYWIGNEKLYELTSIFCNCTLHIDMYYGGLWYYEEYSTFAISNETDGYRLLLGPSPSGNASGALDGQNYKQFSTNDTDNSGSNCGAFFGVGWWYGTSKGNCQMKPCGVTNLNAELQCFAWSSLGNLTSSKMYAVCDNKS